MPGIWLHSVFGKTLRDCRAPILGWGLGIGIMTPLIFALTPGLLADPQARESILALVQHPAMRIFAEPVDVLSPAGYATWRLSLILPLLGIWALLAVTRTVRGEEESGALDVLLSAPRSRQHVVTAKVAGIAVALAAIGLVIGLMAWAGSSLTHAPVGLGAALLFGLNATLLASVFGACALVASQFTTGPRSAAGITGVLLGLSMMMTSAGRTVPNGTWIGQISPVYYFEQSKPLVASVGVKPAAMLGLGGLAAGLAGAGIALFLRRDLGGVVALPFGAAHTARQVSRCSSGWLIRSLFARGVGSMVAGTAGWGLALAVYAGGMTAILQMAQENLMDLLERVAARAPMYAELVTRLTGGRDAALNARSLTAIFTLIAAVVAAFAVSLASRWAVEEEDGRFDLLLATPHRRREIMLARFAALTLAIALVAATVCASVGLTAWLTEYALDPAGLVQAAFGMVPIAVLVAAVGYLLSGWLRAAAVTGTLTALLVASFLVTLLGPLFKWPWYVMQLSIFELYGTPLVDGLHTNRVLGLLALSALILTAATTRFATKDLVR